MVKFTSSYNPKVKKNVPTPNNSRQHYLSLSIDLKAEQFIRLNILPFIISTRLGTDSTDPTKKFEDLQRFSKIKYKVAQSCLEFPVIESFISDFLICYKNTVTEGVTKKISISLINDFLDKRRADKTMYIPNIFMDKRARLNRKNDLLSYRAREMLVEYLNILYFDDYTALYTINFSENYGYYIVANSSLRSNDQILPGISARISEPKQCIVKSSMIWVMNKMYELMSVDKLLLFALT